jgi:hypothetical protein
MDFESLTRNSGQPLMQAVNWAKRADGTQFNSLAFAKRAPESPRMAIW